MFQLLRVRITKTWRERQKREQYDRAQRESRALGIVNHKDAPPLISQTIDELELATALLSLFKAQCGIKGVQAAALRPHYYWTTIRAFNFKYAAQFKVAVSLLQEACAVLDFSVSPDEFGSNSKLPSRYDTRGLVSAIYPLLLEKIKTTNYGPTTLEHVPLLVRCFARIQYELDERIIIRLMKILIDHQDFKHASLLIYHWWWLSLSEERTHTHGWNGTKYDLVQFIRMLARVLQLRLGGCAKWGMQTDLQLEVVRVLKGLLQIHKRCSKPSRVAALEKGRGPNNMAEDDVLPDFAWQRHLAEWKQSTEMIKKMKKALGAKDFVQVEEELDVWLQTTLNNNMNKKGDSSSMWTHST